MLDTSYYTLKNALNYQMFLGHCKETSNPANSRVFRTYHAFMALLEFPPVVGQIIALFELTIVKLLDLKKSNNIKVTIEKKNEVSSEKKNEVSSWFSLNSITTKTKQFIGGVASVSLAGSTSYSLVSLAKYFKFIPQNPCYFWNDFQDTIQKITGIVMSPLDAWKYVAPTAVLIGGIGEELVFRGVVQDLLLTKLLGKAIKKISPSNASWVDTKTAKIFRIAITSALFAGGHLITLTEEVPLGIKFQAFHALAIGFIFGAIKESHLGLMGSIGCHMMNNAIGSRQIYLQCVSNES